MTALISLGVRLVRSGGMLRWAAVIAGSAIAVAVLSVAWVLPDAMYPVVEDYAPPQRAPLSALLACIAVPVLVLLLTVGRLSSDVRDRRLAALRLLGVGTAKAAMVAVVENGLPAAVGALLGLLGFLGLRSLLTVVLGDLLVQPIMLAWSQVAAIAGAVVLLSVCLALASLRALARNPRAARSEAVRRRPSWWRLAPLVGTAAALVWLMGLPPGQTDSETGVLVVGAGLGGAVSVVLGAPLASYWVSVLFVRSGRLSGMLAGRAVQSEAASISRRVVALAVTTYVAFVGAGVLGVFESAKHLQYAIHAVEVGPQRIMVDPGSDDPMEAATIDSETVLAVSQVPGVRAVLESVSVQSAECTQGGPTGCFSVFVGTCEQLAARMQVTGCRDDQAAWIKQAHVGDWSDMFVQDPEVVDSIELADTSIEAGERFVIDLGAPLTQDMAATAATYGIPSSDQLFVPREMVSEQGLATTTLNVIVDKGADVRAAVEAAALSTGATAHMPELDDYRSVMTTRITTWTLLAVAIGIALLTFALASVDRAKATRRARARLIGVGVPAALLRRSQLVQNLLPLTAGVGLAVMLGLLGAVTFADSAQLPLAIEPRVLGAMLGLVLIGSLLVSLATLPLTRSRLRAEDLREE